MKKLIYILAVILLCSYVPAVETSNASIKIKSADDGIKPDYLGKETKTYKNMTYNKSCNLFFRVCSYYFNSTSANELIGLMIASLSVALIQSELNPILWPNDLTKPLFLYS